MSKTIILHNTIISRVMSQIFLFLKYVLDLFFSVSKWAQPPLNSKQFSFYGLDRLGYFYETSKIYRIFHIKKTSKKPSKSFNSLPVASIFLIFCMKLRLRHTNKTWFLDFWYFAILPLFWTLLGAIFAQNRNNSYFWPQKRPKIEKNQKVLFVSPSPWSPI